MGDRGVSKAPSKAVSKALLTDLYELTMAAAYLAEGMADAPATFSLFVRHLPPDRGFLVAAGLDDALTYLEDLAFDADDVAAVAGLGLFDDAFVRWLGDVRFTGRVRAVPEGTLVFADEPILEVDGPVAVAQIAETYVLNQVTLQTTLATKCVRCQLAAGDADVVDFALRRTQGIDAGMKLARCARIAGLAATSNVAGAVRYGLPASGTMAHSFVEAFPREVDAFRAFARHARDRTVLLVDTYDTRRGVARAIAVAREMRQRGEELRAVRLDSGDLVELARDARAALDEAGFGGVRIFASGGLDEYEIARLREEGAPIDGFGVGTSMGVSRDAPSLDSAYKLVEFDGRPVRKTSEGKRTWPGPKQVWRRPRFGGDVLGISSEDAPDGADPLLVAVMQEGRRSAGGFADLDASARRCAAGLSGLPEGFARLRGPDRYSVTPSDALRALAEGMDASTDER